MGQEKLIQAIMEASKNLDRLPKATYIQVPVTIQTIMEYYNCTEKEAEEITNGLKQMYHDTN